MKAKIIPVVFFRDLMDAVEVKYDFELNGDVWDIYEEMYGVEFDTGYNFYFPYEFVDEREDEFLSEDVVYIRKCLRETFPDYNEVMIEV